MAPASSGPVLACPLNTKLDLACPSRRQSFFSCGHRYLNRLICYPIASVVYRQVFVMLHLQDHTPRSQEKHGSSRNFSFPTTPASFESFTTMLHPKDHTPRSRIPHSFPTSYSPLVPPPVVFEPSTPTPTSRRRATSSSKLGTSSLSIRYFKADGAETIKTSRSSPLASVSPNLQSRYPHFPRTTESTDTATSVEDSAPPPFTLHEAGIIQITQAPATSISVEGRPDRKITFLRRISSNPAFDPRGRFRSKIRRVHSSLAGKRYTDTSITDSSEGGAETIPESVSASEDEMDVSNISVSPKSRFSAPSPRRSPSFLKLRRSSRDLVATTLQRLSVVQEHRESELREESPETLRAPPAKSTEIEVESRKDVADPSSTSNKTLVDATSKCNNGTIESSTAPAIPSATSLDTFHTANDSPARPRSFLGRSYSMEPPPMTDTEPIRFGSVHELRSAASKQLYDRRVISLPVPDRQSSLASSRRTSTSQFSSRPLTVGSGEWIKDTPRLPRGPLFMDLQDGRQVNVLPSAPPPSRRSSRPTTPLSNNAKFDSYRHLRLKQRASAPIVLNTPIERNGSAAGLEQYQTQSKIPCFVPSSIIKHQTPSRRVSMPLQDPALSVGDAPCDLPAQVPGNRSKDTLVSASSEWSTLAHTGHITFSEPGDGNVSGNAEGVQSSVDDKDGGVHGSSIPSPALSRPRSLPELAGEGRPPSRGKASIRQGRELVEAHFGTKRRGKIRQACGVFVRSVGRIFRKGNGDNERDVLES